MAQKIDFTEGILSEQIICRDLCQHITLNMLVHHFCLYGDLTQTVHVRTSWTLRAVHAWIWNVLDTNSRNQGNEI